MKRYLLEGMLESPLVIRRQRQSQRSDGATYISGTLLRGAFAQAYLQRFGAVDDTFRQLFLDESRCRFGPLDPGNRVFPLTAVSCKRHPGFRSDGHHGVADQLQLRLQGRFSEKLSPPQRCGHAECGQDLKAQGGFWTSSASGAAEPKQRWHRSLAAHVGIDPFTQTASDSIFFTLPTMEPDYGDASGAPYFFGTLEADDELRTVLRETLEDDDNLLALGHAKTRGYGKIRVQVGDPLDPPKSPWEDWSTAMLQLLGVQPPVGDEWFLFSISLPTGAILLDEVLRYTLDLSGLVPWLPPLPPPDPGCRLSECPTVERPGGQLTCLGAVARHELVRGWNVAHGMPRQDEWAVSRGSVYVYLHRGSQADRAALCETLRILEADGVGIRRNEGFGRIEICDSFHIQFANQG